MLGKVSSEELCIVIDIVIDMLLSASSLLTSWAHSNQLFTAHYSLIMLSNGYYLVFSCICRIRAQNMPHAQYVACLSLGHSFRTIGTIVFIYLDQRYAMSFEIYIESVHFSY